MNKLETAPFQVYFNHGVRIYGVSKAGGYQLVKYDINLPLDFAPDASSVQVRGEFLRNGRIFSTTKEMYAYLTKYVKHTVKNSSESTRGKHFAPRTLFDRRRSLDVFARDPWNPRKWTHRDSCADLRFYKKLCTLCKEEIQRETQLNAA